MVNRMIFILLLLFVSAPIQGQFTTEYYDTDWNRIESKEKAEYYREITYDQTGRPLGIVRDYYITGELQFVRELVTVNPDTMNGTCIWYHRNGQKSQEVIYENGVAVGPTRNWSEEGKEEGVLDESGFYYSVAYRNDNLRAFQEAFGQELGVDSSSINLLSRIGVSLVNKGELNFGLAFFQLSHDVARLLDHEGVLAITYNNIGEVYIHLGAYEEALEWLNKALSIEERLGLKKESASSCSNIASVYKLQGKNEQALIWFKKAVSIEGREENLASYYNNIGVVYLSQGDYEQALTWLSKAIDIGKRLGLPVNLASSYNNIGRVHTFQGSYEQALIWHKKAMEIERRLGLKVNLASSYNNIGMVYTFQGSYEKALIWLSKAIDIGKRLGLPVNLASSYSNFGMVHYYLGKYEQALSWINKAKGIQLELDLKVNLADSYSNLGLVHQSQGKYGRALIWFHKSREIRDSLGLEVDLAKSYGNIGMVFYSQGKYEQALTWHKRAKDLQEKLDLWAELSVSYNNIGLAYFAQGAYEQALIWYHKAKDIQERIEREAKLAAIYSNIGMVFQSQGKYRQTLSWYNQARMIRDSLGLEVDLARSYNNIGFVYHSQGDFEQAVKWYARAKEIQERLKLGVDLENTYHNISFAYYHLHRLDSVLFYAQMSIELNEDLRRTNQGKTDRQLFVDKNLEPIETGILSAYQLEKHSLAFAFSEKTKARAMSDLLAEKSIEDLSLSEVVMTEFGLLRKKLKTVQQELASEIPKAKRQNLGEQRDSLYRVLQEIEDQIKVLAPEYANLVYPETTNTIKLQSILQPQEVLISYFTGYRHSFAFVATPLAIEMIDLGSSDSLRLLVEDYRSNLVASQKLAIQRQDAILQSGVDEQFFELSSELYQRLWSPLDSTGLFKDKKVIIVPDGFLNYLPFELLINDEEQKTYEEYNYLIHDHTISYYPSATVLHYERTKKKGTEIPSKEFFGLGITDFKNTNCTNDGNVYADLSTIATSVDQLANLFSSNQSVTILNEQASESAFKSLDLIDYRYLHFATHGTIDAETPEFSSILLQPDDQENGCLNMYEIFELDFKADLVTLAACQTGLGKLVRGEGMVGFTRALMYAGTPSVILSLWEVADESTNRLFLDYYSKLAEDGLDKYAPLRAAQLKMIESGKYSNPFYWAPFVFIGSRESKF